MKTQEFLRTGEAELVPRLKEMKIKELERHAQKILNSYGSTDYSTVMKQLIQTIPTLDPADNNRFQIIQDIVSSRVSTVKCSVEPNPDAFRTDIIQRLTVLLTVIITRKFQKIHSPKGSSAVH
ncbi:hypothetical protein [Teredinibacter purpureus]|jgi:hypothetical protein|uniref:hypothetical protein n=1 Tax=Teredinibacter purpureus TaxID=2731756 RepID=UPI0005F7A4F5|nr:hypothetical protein [Teredinibacter purpureus]